MEHISNLFGGTTVKYRSYREELIDYIYNKVKGEWEKEGERRKKEGLKSKALTHRYINFRLTNFTVKDILYIKSLCDQEEKRGYLWSKMFWGSIKPR